MTWKCLPNGRKQRKKKKVRSWIAYAARLMPASVEVCVLLDKDVRRIVDLPIAYRGFSIPDRFVVGYGLDLDAGLRNLPYIATLPDSVMGM